MYGETHRPTPSNKQGCAHMCNLSHPKKSGNAYVIYRNTSTCVHMRNLLHTQPHIKDMQVTYGYANGKHRHTNAQKQMEKKNQTHTHRYTHGI